MTLETSLDLNASLTAHGLTECGSLQGYSAPNTAVSKHSCMQKFLYPNIPVSKHCCIQPLQNIILKKFESIRATKFPFELFLCLTTACLNEFAQFVNVNCPNKAWSVIFPAQTEPLNLFSWSLLVTDFIFSSGGCDIFKDASVLFHV